MKQLTQELKSDSIEILEVPFPTINKGHANCVQLFLSSIT